MSKIKTWILKFLIRKQIKINVTELYTFIRTESQKEFYEDNSSTVNDFLRERFEQSLRNHQDSV